MTRALWSILALFCCVSAAASPPEPKPKVRLTFLIEGDAIKGALGEQPSAYMTEVETAAKCILEKQFPYLEWVTSGNPLHSLTLVLMERQAVLDLEHALQYRASVRLGDPPTHAIYTFDDPAPDPKDLQADLLDRIKKDLTKSEAETRRHFASQVPLVRRIGIDNQSVILPVTGISAEQAHFQVSFMEGTARRGAVLLTTPLDAPEKGIYCAIDNFDYPPDISNARWHSGIPKVIREKGQNVTVTVKDFTPRAHENTSGGTVTALRPTRTQCDL